jgi:shikimate kinase
MPQNNTTPTNGASSASLAGTGPNMVDISNLPANAMLLVKQLLTAIVEKSSTEGSLLKRLRRSQRRTTKLKLMMF